MRYVVQRLGFRISRGWAIMFVAVGALLATAFWIGPFRPLPPELQLLVLAPDGQFRPAVALPESVADTTPPQPDSRARFPLILAVYNAGARGATPRQLALNIPARYRLSNSAGQEYPGRLTIGNPLVRYVFDIAPGRINPRQLPRVLSTLDTLWLEPVLPSYYCTALADSVPEFLPAPRQDPNALARLQIFYSFDARLRDRQTGLISLQLPPRLLERAPPPPPPTFTTTVMRPKAVQPPMNALRLVGARTVQCGDPGSPLELLSTLYETDNGGRYFVLNFGGAPRKYLYDLDRDSLIELEIWDMDSDGVFEATRPARLAIPEFLLPPRPPPPVLLARDSMPPDSLRSDSARLAASPAAGDSAGADRARGADGFEFPPAVFHNTDAGPLRFWRAQQRARGIDIPEPRRRPTGPRLLGTPVPNYAPPVRRDTLRTDTLRVR